MIDSFKGEYFFLSNFYELEPPITIAFNGINSIGKGVGTFKSVEAAFQAGKANGKPSTVKNYESLNPSQAKHAGRRESLNSQEKKDWDTVKKFVLMKQCLQKKFDDNHPDLQQKLLATGDEELVEGNTWKDTIWGVCNGIGENRLGKLLMEIRESLKMKER